MRVSSGFDGLIQSNLAAVRGYAVGLVCNQASVSHDLQHITDVFAHAHRKGVLCLRAIFGPQHGLGGHTQDNMIEWEGYVEPRLGVPVYSLYGQHRKPTAQMLHGIDKLIIDLQDVGARYYTFVWTVALCLEACAEQGIEVVILDRPNPISGQMVEGCLLEPSYHSFVGLHPLPVRHGMTMGELARYLQANFYPRCRLTVIPMQGWQRAMYYDETGCHWVMPSPNMPSVDTAIVYPGMCLLEATNLSEGRGTTRPFEMFGAPWLDGWRLADALNRAGLAGVWFRPLEFQPTFNKFAGDKCGGVFIHVLQRQLYEPFLTGLLIVSEIFKRYPDQFQWKLPPYEYEYEKMPFDILVGNGWLRREIESGAPVNRLKEKWQDELAEFLCVRQQFLLY